VKVIPHVDCYGAAGLVTRWNSSSPQAGLECSQTQAAHGNVEVSRETEVTLRLPFRRDIGTCAMLGERSLS